MKKSLLAVAVAAALPTIASAQSSVTLYGILDGAMEYSNAQANYLSDKGIDSSVTSGAKATYRVNSGTQSGSRLGIRGSEDLGNGLRGIFTIEHRLSVDTGATTKDALGNDAFWYGQAFVGVSSNWGQVTVGRQYTPLFAALAPADFTGYTGYNNWAGFSGNGFKDLGPQGPIRLDNTVAYKSPTIGGLTVIAAYSAGEQTTSSTTATPANKFGGATGGVAGIAATWQFGGLYLAAGYHAVDNNLVGTTSGSVTSLESVAAGAASYKFNDFGLSLGYTQQNFVGGDDIKIILGSAFANFGPGTLFANVAQIDPSLAGRRNDGALQYGLTYSVPLSKRTNVYAAFGGNDLSGLQLTSASTVIDNALRASVGVRHMF